MRPLNLQSTPEHQRYHFIHLTFQEYFAAHYFVKIWRHPSKHLYFSLSSEGSSPCTARDYLREHKYTPRYEVFWRFVAGLLKNELESTEFLRIIEQEPLDLLGPAHQRLLMRCLSEMPSCLPMRANFDRRLKEWVLHEIESRGYSKLIGDNEFPETVLNTLLQQDIQKPFFREGILQSLKDRAYIPSTTLEAVFLGPQRQKNPSCEAFDLLRGPAPLTPTLTSFLVGELRGKSPETRCWAVEAIGSRPDLPDLSDEILTAMASCLSHSEPQQLRCSALKTLAYQAVLPDEITALMTSCLRDPDQGVRCEALRAWGKRKFWSEQVYLHVTACFNDADSVIRFHAIHVFKNRKSLALEVFLPLLAEKLTDEDFYVQNAASRALGAQTSLPEQIVSVIEGYIRTGRFSTQSFAIKALSGQSTLSNELLHDLLRLFRTGDDPIRRQIVKLLSGLREIPINIIWALSECLGDNRSVVRARAVAILGQRSDLPAEILQRILVRSRDEDNLMRNWAAKTLGNREELPDEVYSFLVQLLDDKASWVRASAAEGLCRQPRLQEDVLIKIANDVNVEGSQAPRLLRTLSGRKDLPREALAAIAIAAQHRSASVRTDAIAALCSTPIATQLFIGQIEQCINDSDYIKSTTAIRAIGRCPKISNESLRKITQRLQSFNVHPRRWIRPGREALSVLYKQTELPDYVLAVLAESLKLFGSTEICGLKEIIQDPEQPCFLRCFLSSGYAAALFGALLPLGFDINLSLYLLNNELCFSVPQGVMRVPVDQSIVSSIRSLRPKDFPAVSGIL